jgi:SAM-dependent methyltransferase
MKSATQRSCARSAAARGSYHRPVNQSDLPEHVLRNRQAWDGWAHEYVAGGESAWRRTEASWGIWGIPEAEVGMLPADLDGKDGIELGCGTAYVSAWLARRGARVVGVDNSPHQLETARRLQDEHGVHFPLMLGNAEQVPYPDASFDFAISEYGASIWADPYRWIPEAARLLRPGGELAFLQNHAFLMCFAPDEDGVPAGECLVRPYFGMHRFEWGTDLEVEFHLPHGQLLRLLRDSGFEVTDLLELRAPEGASTRYDFVTAEWAVRWPSEEVWKARRRA